MDREMTNVTSQTVFSARRAYCRRPTVRNLRRFERLWKAYRERFPRRDLCFFSRTVTIRCYV